ncbi:hypothetical protein NVP1101O_060 [Vibrio phage 1.101.O._10N.261.45.C6]|nr:hypothetical protein NVP1101O_060 [Vibrio phage 1.101.O._10N.261.45.C6]
MKGINELTASQVKNWNNDKNILGKWVPARPEGREGFLRRVKLAWKVFTGKADVLVWYHQ